MGSERRKSSDRAIARVQKPRTERETLNFCPACQGQRQHVTELPDGRYKARECRWCEGTGCVDRRMFKLFKRWLRIFDYNRRVGACPRK